MHKSEKNSITINKEGSVESLQAQQLHTIIYKVQPVIFRYLQKELFSTDSTRLSSAQAFQDWIIEHHEILKKISDCGKEIVQENLEKGKDLNESEVASFILDNILNDDELREVLKKIKPDIDFDNFNYFEIEDIINDEHPEWNR